MSYSQKILPRLSDIKTALRSAGHQAVFLITGNHFVKEHDLHFLDGVAITHYIKQGPNVEEKEIEVVLEQFNKEHKTALIAIGGGSVMDLAKTIIYRRKEMELAIPYFIAVPTTAGSGSEATHFAVMYKGAKKHSLVDEDMLPSLVVLDPELCRSLSPYQTAVSGMDALSQAIESHWNRNATELSKEYAEEAIDLWKESFIPAVNGEEGAREKMLHAAHLAGKAINITRTTGPHALSYYLTANHTIPHGHAVALFLPPFILYNNNEEVNSLLETNNAVAAADYVIDKMKASGLATMLAELNVSKHTIIDALLDEVNEERFANNPVGFDREKLKQLFLECL